MNFYTSVVRYKNDILYRGVENGKRVFAKERFQPTLYIKNPKEQTSALKTLQGVPVTEVTFDSMWEAKQYLGENQTDDGWIQGTTNWISQFISDNFPEPEIQYDIKKMCIASIDIETTCEDGFPDVDAAEEQITVITLYNSLEDKYYVFGLNPKAFSWEVTGKGRQTFKPEMYEEFLKEMLPLDAEIEKITLEYKGYDDEASMLRGFMKVWRRIYPDVITGWNVQFFDIPYLVNRLKKLLGEEKAMQLSPWDKVDARTVFHMNKDMLKYVVFGVAVLDYLDLYKKFSMGNRASFKLDYIAEYEGIGNKLSYEEHSQMHLFYKDNYPKFIAYNIRDVELIVKMEESLRMIELAINIAFTAKINFDEMFSPVRTITNIAYNHLLEKNIVLPHQVRREKERQISGAFVKKPIVGKHEWVVSFDLNSLYPSIIMQNNMSPETVIDGRHFSVKVPDLVNQSIDLPSMLEKDVTMAANGHFFKTDERGFLPEIIEKLYAERKANKKKMIEADKASLEKGISKTQKKKLQTQKNIYHVKQYSQKILLNSIYGATANQYFMFFDPRIAEGITRHGQFIIQWAEKHINEYLNKVLQTDNVDYVIAIDTDSVYITLDSLVQKLNLQDKTNEEIVDFLDRVCAEKFEPLLDKCYKKLANYTNAYENTMVMAREVIASRGIWTGKKHYALNVYDNEGVRYPEPKLKAMGLETAKSSTPEFVREALKDAIHIAMNGEEEDLIKFVEETKAKYLTLPVGDIAYPKGLSDMTKWKDSTTLYKKGCPIHVRGGIMYNHLLEQHSLVGQYADIKDGEKIKYTYLKEPNPSKGNIMSFVDSLPSEFGLDPFIDYEKMFNDSFINPLEEIIKHAEWTVKPKPQTLESLFV